MPAVDTPVAWDILVAYRMVRQRDHALTDRQRLLQAEQSWLDERIAKHRKVIDTLGDAIGTVEKAGGDASNLRIQINAAHVEVRRIEPRLKYLQTATSLIAANLRLLHQAHDALHWLNFENAKLADFDKTVEVPPLERP